MRLSECKQMIDLLTISFVTISIIVIQQPWQQRMPTLGHLYSDVTQTIVYYKKCSIGGASLLTVCPLLMIVYSM